MSQPRAAAPAGLRRRLRAMVNYIGTIALIVAYAPPAILSGLLNRRDSLGAWCKRSFGQRLMKLCGVRTSIQGLEHVPSTGGFVLVANHESHFDPPLLCGWIPRSFSALAKRELFSLPVLGHGFRGLGFLSLDRENRRQAMESLNEAARYIADGGGMLVFPEGHRSDNGELLEFQAGAFILALRAGAPILPVAIAGTRAVLPRGKLCPEPGRVHVVVGPCIDTRGKSVRERRALTATTRDRITELVATAREHLTQEAQPVGLP